MSALLAVVRYEYRMAVRRWGMWIAFAIAAAPYVIPALTDPIELGPTGPASAGAMWAFAGSTAMNLNFWLPIVGGIAMADRLQRDFRLGIRELLGSTPLGRRRYVLGKYAGVVAATVTPVLATLLLLAAILSARGLAAGVSPMDVATMLGGFCMGFLAIIMPAYLFVGAFSLACPAVLPVRIYQVLYAGYWVWGNFLNPEFIPTLAGTLLTPSGEYAAAGFFGAGKVSGMPAPLHTPAEGLLSIVALLASAAVALYALERYLAWRERRA